MKARENLIGVWAYTLGVIIAIIVGVIVGFNLDASSYNTISIWASLILIVLGITIGFMNESSIDNRPYNPFLIAGVILVLVSYFGVNSIQSGVLVVGVIGRSIVSIFNSLLLLFVPATIVVALKTLFRLTRV